MIVKPTFIQNFEEEKFMEPVICEWVNNPLMLTMHLFHPLLVVQIVNISFNPLQNIYDVELSEGVHSIPASVDLHSNCYVGFSFEDVDIYDFIVVRESCGHPATFDFKLVSNL